jgi:hypothetical protein
VASLTADDGLTRQQGGQLIAAVAADAGAAGVASASGALGNQN